MNSGQTVFSQLMEFAPRYEFRRCVERYRGDYKVQSFSCWDHFLTLAFAQLTYRESLRDIEACLRAAPTKLYHMGIRSQVSRNTLAHANQVRDWRIYADFAQELIRAARAVYVDEAFAVELDQVVYAMDATTIDLCLSLFPWAQFRRHKSAVKLHTLLDLRGNIPTVLMITSGRVHDTKFLDHLVWEAGAIYLMDRGYLHFERLYRIHQSGAFFVTRSRQTLDFQRHSSKLVDKSTGLRSDQLITLNNPVPKRGYPERFRRIRYIDPESQRCLVFLTNNTLLPAMTIADLYRCRWQVELFFRWIKCILGCRHWLAESPQGAAIEIYLGLIAALLLQLYTGQRPNRRMMELIQFYLLGVASLEELERGLAAERARVARRKKS